MLSRPNADGVFLATPYWMLKHLGLDTGGSQYAMLRESLVRLTAVSYQNSGFYNPETQEHEYAAFQFLSILLPTVGGVGGIVDNDRCWRIEWNPAFFRFCRATGGNLLFDLDLYGQLTPAARRLFLKLKDRFWRSHRVFLNVDDLTIDGLGFSADRPLYKRKFDLTNCIRELLQHRIISLGKGQTDPKDLFLKRGKGTYVDNDQFVFLRKSDHREQRAHSRAAARSNAARPPYVVMLYAGDYFRQPLTKRTIHQPAAITDDPLFEPLQKIGVDEAGIRRLFQNFSRGAISRWVKITDAAMHERRAANFRNADQFSLSGKQFNVYFEIDQSTESVDSRAEQSIREKLVRYEAYQDSLVAWHNAQTASVSWPYFRVVFLTRSVERANHILWLARECARNANQHLVYAATQNAYLTEPRALQTPLFVDHHSRWQALVNVHPTSNFQRTPVRLIRPVTRLAAVW